MSIVTVGLGGIAALLRRMQTRLSAPCAIAVFMLLQPFAQPTGAQLNQQLSFQVAGKSRLRDVLAGERPPVELELFGDPEQFGTFSGANFGLSAGGVISTGKVPSLISVDGAQPGQQQQFGHDFYPKGPVGDAASLVLRFDLEEDGALAMNFIIGHTENADDAMGALFKDDTRIELNGRNFIDSATELSVPQDTSLLSNSFKAISKLKELTVPLKKGANILNVTCADTGDGLADSFVLIGDKSLVVSRTAVSLPPPPPPATSVWSAGEWLECSVSCGPGRQFRQVSCVDAERQPSSDCSAEKPAGIQLCTISCDEETVAMLAPAAPSAPATPTPTAVPLTPVPTIVPTTRSPTTEEQYVAEQEQWKMLPGCECTGDNSNLGDIARGKHGLNYGRWCSAWDDGVCDATARVGPGHTCFGSDTASCEAHWPANENIDYNPPNNNGWCCDSWCYVSNLTCTEEKQRQYGIKVKTSWVDNAVGPLHYSYGACPDPFTGPPKSTDPMDPLTAMTKSMPSFSTYDEATCPYIYTKDPNAKPAKKLAFKACPEKHIKKIKDANETYKKCFKYYFDMCRCRRACDCLKNYTDVVEPCLNSTDVMNGSLSEIHAQFVVDNDLCEISRAGKAIGLSGWSLLLGIAWLVL